MANDNANSPNGNFPFGQKSASGFAARADVSGGTSMPNGILRSNSAPLRAAPSLPTGVVDGIPKITTSAREHLAKIDGGAAVLGAARRK